MTQRLIFINGLPMLLACSLFAAEPGAATAQGSGTSQGAPLDLPANMSTVMAENDRAAEDLKSHGIGLSDGELISFLENGLPKKDKYPLRPQEKSQLIIDAIARLTISKPPGVTSVLLKLAALDTKLGAFKVVEYDVSKTSPQARDEFRGKAYRLVQYNAINALGLIGDKEAIPLVRRALQDEQTAAGKIQFAISLATMGDATGVPVLVGLIGQENRRESAAAAKAFFMCTGKDFGYTRNTPVRARRVRAQEYRQWWQANQTSFRPDPAAVRERRISADSPASFEPRSTRDLLKVAANYFDFNNKGKSAHARKALGDAGGSFNKEYERIASDVMEDLDVRMEAMNWYFEANRADPAELFKKLRRDENPEIADKAQVLLEQIATEAARNTQVSR